MALELGSLAWQLVWAGKRHIQPGNDFFPGEIFSKLWLGRMEERKGGKSPFLVPGMEQGLGHLSPAPQQLFLSAVKGTDGLNFLTTGIFWSFPKSDKDWAELEWEGEKVGEHRGVCGVGNAKGHVCVLHMENRNWGAQEALISPDVAKIK